MSISDMLFSKMDVFEHKKRQIGDVHENSSARPSIFISWNVFRKFPTRYNAICKPRRMASRQAMDASI
jgi:hypothetical protein